VNVAQIFGAIGVTGKKYLRQKNISEKIYRENIIESNIMPATNGYEQRYDEQERLEYLSKILKY